MKLNYNMSSNLRDILIENAKKRQEMQDRKMASIPTMVKNLAETAINTVKIAATGESIKVSDEEANSRKNICNSCPFFNKAQERCNKCGCYMAIKTYLKASNCPIGKW
jgi:hypothetical protein